MSVFYLIFNKYLGKKYLGKSAVGIYNIKVLAIHPTNY